MKSTVIITLIAFAVASEAFAPATHQPCAASSSALSASRRGAIEKLGTAAFSAGLLLLSGDQPARAAATQEEEFNELISVLKARSDENKEANANYAMRADKMNSKDFKDAKTRRPKLM